MFLFNANPLLRVPLLRWQACFNWIVKKKNPAQHSWEKVGEATLKQTNKKCHSSGKGKFLGGGQDGMLTPAKLDVGNILRNQNLEGS